jgi:penicillin-insensitive murein DD-endopeptidase
MEAPPLLKSLNCLLFIACLASGAAFAEESVCYGTTAKGRLERGAQLPSSGPNFSSYSTVGSLAGRTYVHSRVLNVVLAAYKSLESSTPGKVFVYGETGWKSGGRIRPHKTHQNGLSVDFMVPVLKDGRSVPLPTSPLNKFGYDLEFDDSGRFDDYSIDFDAIAKHLLELSTAASIEGIKINRVIFEVPLQEHLFATSQGAQLKSLMTFSTKQAWVKHDEHYHVDFELPCKAFEAEQGAPGYLKVNVPPSRNSLRSKSPDGSTLPM